ncbi:hypothetical protein ACH4TQ_32840 [Streptomyces sp. NPDC021218]|uniref:hypothetical protein n=1 Tax=Streptomyces sp. NPDC021218 TaxID=3365119 RepID=UPI0037A936D8
MSEPITPEAAPVEDAVTALLRAVHDALDLPLPGLTDEDEREHRALLINRAADARIVLAGVLERGLRMETASTFLRGRTATLPVTYTPWMDKGAPA